MNVSKVIETTIAASADILVQTTSLVFFAVDPKTAMWDWESLANKIILAVADFIAKNNKPIAPASPNPSTN